MHALRTASQQWIALISQIEDLKPEPTDNSGGVRSPYPQALTITYLALIVVLRRPPLMRPSLGGRGCS